MLDICWIYWEEAQDKQSIDFGPILDFIQQKKIKKNVLYSTLPLHYHKFVDGWRLAFHYAATYLASLIGIQNLAG